MNKINGWCRNCGSANLYFYDGWLGYEAVVCRDCNTHHSDAKPIIVNKEENHGSSSSAT